LNDAFIVGLQNNNIVTEKKVPDPSSLLDERAQCFEPYVMKMRDASFRKAVKRKGRFFVYIVQCRDGTYYTGYTKDLENRIALHKSGRGAKYVKNKLPAELVYAKQYRYYKNALNEEKRVKTLTRQQKSELVRSYAENNSEIVE